MALSTFAALTMWSISSITTLRIVVAAKLLWSMIEYLMESVRTRSSVSCPCEYIYLSVDLSDQARIRERRRPCVEVLGVGDSKYEQVSSALYLNGWRLREHNRANTAARSTCACECRLQRITRGRGNAHRCEVQRNGAVLHLERRLQQSLHVCRRWPKREAHCTVLRPVGRS